MGDEFVNIERVNLLRYLITLNITSDNIGDIRRSLFFPWESPWNGLVRDLTAALENKELNAPQQPTT